MHIINYNVMKKLPLKFCRHMWHISGCVPSKW